MTAVDEVGGWDLLVVGGTALPGTGPGAGPLVVGVRGGRVAHLGTRRPPGRARRVLDARGAFVVPGLVDLHTHVAPGLTPLGVDADRLAPASGVTTWVDAGSCGAAAIGGFVDQVVDRASVRILPFCHLSSIGLAGLGLPGGSVGELEDLRRADAEAVRRVVAARPGRVRGLKVRLSPDAVGRNGAAALAAARALADDLGLPLMVHGSGQRLPLRRVLAALRGGDVLTHCFNGSATGRLLTPAGRVRPEVRDALARGVVLDVGHGASGFSRDAARRALDAGLLPTTISTDVHVFSAAGPAGSLLDVMAIFLSLGMELHDVVRRVTAAPADVVGEPRLGRLAVGAPADVAILAVEEPDTPGSDGSDLHIHPAPRLVARATVAGGAVLSDPVDGKIFVPSKVLEVSSFAQ